MQRWFSRLLITLGVVGTSTVLILFLMLFFLTPETTIYEFLRVVLRGLMWCLPLLTIGVIITGITSYLESNRQKKQKAGYIPYADSEDAEFEEAFTGQNYQVKHGRIKIDQINELWGKILLQK